jgi:hypothetical protein
MTFVRPDGTRLDQIVGYRPPDRFLHEAADVLAGRTGIDRARAALVGAENEPMKRDDLAQELARAGRHAEALVEYLWSWDHGLEHDPSYLGVRGSFLLSWIEELARVHPPAKEAMLERGDAVAALVREGRAEPQQMRDMIAIHAEFGLHDRTLALFDELARDDERAAACRTLAETIAPQLVKERRYEDLVVHGPNVAVILRERRATVENFERELDEHGPGEDHAVSALRIMRTRAAGEVGPYFEALVAVGARPGLDQPSADEVQEQILALCADGWTFYRLIQHATRAGDHARARALAARGRATLTDERELKRIERAARKIPAAAAAGG